MNADERRNLEREWEALIPQILNLCRRVGGSVDRGDEIFQRTAIRVQRKLDGYRGNSSLMTWASAIVQHEKDRLFVQEIAEGRRRAPVDLEKLTDLELKSSGTAGMHRKAVILSAAARTAATTGQLTEVEAKVVLARLDNP